MWLVTANMWRSLVYVIHATGSHYVQKRYLIDWYYIIMIYFVAMCYHHERLCAYSCEDMDMDGTFVLCEDCRKYLICDGDSHTLHDCPHKPNWGFNVDTRKCQHKSPHCFVCSGKLYNTLLLTAIPTHYVLG